MSQFFAALLALALTLPVHALYDFPVGTVIRDQEIEDAIWDICAPIYKVAGIPPQKVKHYIIIDPDLNAATGSGPTLMMNSGFILRASAHEFAGVIAHETGHMRGRHVEIGQTVIQEKQKLGMATMLLGLGTAVVNPGAGVAIAASGPEMAMRSFLHYSRGKEASADQAAVEILRKLNWPISGLTSFLQRIHQRSHLSSDKPDPYRVTHPITEERIDVIQRQAKEFQKAEPEFPSRLAEKYEMAKAKLKGFCQIPAITQNEYRNTYKSSAPAQYAWAVSLHKMHKNKEAVELLNDLISKNPKNPYFHELKGQILFLSGKRADAIQAYKKALQLIPKGRLIRLTYINVLLDSADRSAAQEALRELKTMGRLEKDNPEYWRLMSVAYGKMSQIGQMAWCLAELAYLGGDTKMASQQIQRAEKTLKSGQTGFLEMQDLKSALKNESDS